jgi:hypothetical protein
VSKQKKKYLVLKKNIENNNYAITDLKHGNKALDVKINTLDGKVDGVLANIDKTIQNIYKTMQDFEDKMLTAFKNSEDKNELRFQNFETRFKSFEDKNELRFQNFETRFKSFEDNSVLTFKNVDDKLNNFEKYHTEVKQDLKSQRNYFIALIIAVLVAGFGPAIFNFLKTWIQSYFSDLPRSGLRQ